MVLLKQFKHVSFARSLTFKQVYFDYLVLNGCASLDVTVVRSCAYDVFYNAFCFGVPGRFLRYLRYDGTAAHALLTRPNRCRDDDNAFFYPHPMRPVVQTN